MIRYIPIVCIHETTKLKTQNKLPLDYWKGVIPTPRKNDICLSSQGGGAGGVKNVPGGVDILENLTPL